MKYIFIIMFLLMLSKNSTSQAVLNEGDNAPDFTLTADGGNQVKLSNFMEKSAVVLYFYPKDFTSGCTKQACNFRDNISLIQENDAVVLGVSADNEDSHRKFKEEYNLNYTLLSDTAKDVISQYAGLKDNGLANRVTFIIDKSGVIRKIYRNVDVNENFKEIIDFLKSM